MQTSVLLIVVCALVGAHGFFFVPGQPQTNLAGQCPSGIPRDGLFQNCALEHWRIGTLDPLTSVVNVTFPTSFTHVPPNVDLDINADTNSKGCAIELHGAGVAFQPLANIRYAHYRLSGCAKPMGNSRCRMVVKDSFNRIVDEIETRGAQCSSDLPPHTCSECLDGFHNITIRYLGSRPTDIIVKREGDTDSSNWLTFMNVMQGDEFTIVPLDFPFSTVGSANPEVLPEVLEFVTTQDNMLTDILSLNCSLPTALPGQTFGDRAQFLMVSAVSGDGDLCPFSPAADVQCQCHVNDADEACMQSSKGFVAFPNQLYYLALVSEECGCQFDNVCLTQVSNFNGYFGVDWIYNSNLTQADFV